MSFKIFSVVVILHLAIAGVKGLELKGIFDKEPYKFFDIKIRPMALNCTADENVEITWHRNGSDVKDLAGLKERHHINSSFEKGVKHSAFVIGIPEDKDTGEYFCKAKGQQLKFFAVPNIVIKLTRDLSVVEGEQANLTCVAIGYKPTIDWILPNDTTIEDGEITFDDQRFSIKDDGGALNNVLLINNARQSDRGHYICEARHLDEHIQQIKDIRVTNKAFLRVKNKLAALWPFIGICAEVFFLCAIIIIYEKRRNKMDPDESDTDQSPDQKNDHTVRHRK